MLHCSPCTDGLDFTPLIQQDVVFGVNTTGRECFFVSIEDDGLLEDSELFNVSILMTPKDPALIFIEQFSVIQITIEDDDSKPLILGM